MDRRRRYEATWFTIRGAVGVDDAVARLENELRAALGDSATVADAVGRRAKATRRPCQAVDDLAVLFGQACKLNAYRSRAELGEMRSVWADSCSVGLRASPLFQRWRREHERT